MDVPATRHSIVAAISHGDAEIRRAGLDALVTVYWKPAYKYFRTNWHLSTDDAQDATQAFFARAIEKRFFDAFDPAKGRFRTFLRTCLDRFAANERKAAARLKRGGGWAIVPLDFETAERELQRHDAAAPADRVDIEEYFHREWVRSLLMLAVEDLRREYGELGKLVQFRVFQRYDIESAESGADATYASVAGELGISPTDVTNYLAAARKAFRRHLLDRLRSVCGDRDEFEAEARQLLRGGLR